MKALGKFFVVVFALFSLAAYSGSYSQNDRDRSSNDTLQFNRVPQQDRGPSFSSPPNTVAPNGDIDSQYPPYYRPDVPSR